MKKCLTIAALLALSACNTPQGKSPSGGDTIASVAMPADNRRDALLNAIDRLAHAVEDSTGAAFAATLPYPIPDSVLFAYVEDQGYTTRFDRDGRVTTEALFRDYLPQISESLQLSEFRELFRQIPASALRSTDSVYRMTGRADEPCARYYLVNIVGDQIEFSYGSDHNDKYRATADAEEEVCEWATIWMYRFDGTRLRLERMYQAG
jgi:hypothetical protein